MNLYLRYFNDETVVSSVEEAVDFLKGLNIEDFEIDDKFVGDLTEFVNSDSTYPKRYKVKQHYYFIVIKTNVQTIEEFKRNNIKSLLENDDNGSANKPSKSSPLSEELYGWYDAQLIFKPETGWCVVDKHSSNGTKLNQRQIQPDVEMTLNNGDVLAVANVNLQVIIR